MNTITSLTKKIGATLAGFALVATLFAGFAAFPQKAHAAIDGDLRGYAWSDTIGWISLNCVDAPGSCASAYKVSVTGDNLSGYGWSDNVGWIGFNTKDVTPPTSPVLCGTGKSGVIDETTGLISGWARVVSGTTTSGADGCISLGGTGYGVKYNAMTVSTKYSPAKTLSGFAWGDVNTGWADFSYAALDAKTAVNCLTVTQDIAFGNQLVLPKTKKQQMVSFIVQNTCTTEAIGLTNVTLGSYPSIVTIGDLTNMYASVNAVVKGAPIAVPSGTDTFNVVPTILVPVGTKTGTNKVTVSINADFGTATSGLFHTDLVATGKGTTTGKAYSSGTAVTGQKDTIINTLPNGTVMLKANGVPSYTFASSAAGPATITWVTSSDATTCTAVGSESYWNSGSPAPINPAAGNLPTGSVGPVTIPANTTTAAITYTYKLNCSTSLGIKTATATIIVPALTPTLDFKVFGARSYTFPSTAGGTASLTWTTTATLKCQADSAYIHNSGGDWDPVVWLPANSGGPYVITIPANTGLAMVSYRYGISCRTMAGTTKDQVDINVPGTATPTTGGTSGPGGTAGPGGTSGTTLPPWKEI